MKTLYLDTEFNGFQGKLMSMALVPSNTEDFEFYKELQLNDQLDPWVRENVVPHMFLDPCTYKDFQNHLAKYLREVGECKIVADWPDDIRYFCEALIVGPGQSLPLLSKITFQLDFSIRYNSEVPHNALYDARAIRDFCQEREAKLRSQNG